MSLPHWPVGVMTALLAAVLAAAGVYAERLNDERHRVALRADVQARLIEVRDRLNGTLISDLQLVRGLVGVINLEPGLDQARFEQAARPLLAGRTQLRNIAAAPDMVIRMVVPVAGNERAIGLDYRTNAQQFPAVDRARRTRQVVVAGPVDLVQGGVGIIARLPVFVADGSGGDRFWGIVSAVIDAERLYASAGLRDPAAPIELAIRGKDAGGAEGEVFFGRAEVFADQPVLTDIELPYGSWRLAALPRGGWPAAADNRWALRLAFGAVALLVLGAFHRLGKALRAASAARREVEAVFESAPDAMLQVAPDGRIVRANSQALKLFAQSREGLLGQAIEVLVPDRVRAHHPRLRDAFFAAPEQRSFGAGRELRGRRADGSEFPMEMTLSPVQTETGTLVTAAIRDITERRRADEALRESEMRFRGLAENSSDWIWVLGLDGRHTYSNDRGLAVLGLDYETFRRKDLGDLIHPDDLSLLHRTFRQAIEARSGWRGVVLRWRHREGGWRTLESNATPLFDTEGRLVGFQGVDRDVTERLAAEAELARHRHHLEHLVEERTAELRAAKTAAEAASVAKSAFLANMSHEIRTPLNAITGMAYLVRRSGVSAEQQQRLDTLQAAAQHLLAVINAILDFSKIEAGKMTLARLPVDLRALAANVHSMLAERARAKGLAFEVDVQAPPQPLLGDPTRLQQALLNFADNAVKFTDAGSVRLQVRGEAAVGGGDGEVTVRFEVHDSGPGIEAQALQRLFGAFEQADNSPTREHGGTGLGLVITRKLAQLMGGDAGASSVPGQGSLFWFTARLAPAPAAAVPAREPRAATGVLPARGARVLLAEDEPVNRTLATLLLEDLGLDVDTADDGEQAIEMAAATDYDLMLMDMQMPRVDGLEATRRIRRLARHGRTPIVAITANAFDSDRVACLDAGMDDFVAKPIDPEALREVMARWLAGG